MDYSGAPWPAFADDEIQAVTDVLSSGQVNYWTGVQGSEFEAEFADFVGTEHAVWVANGTAALELSLRSLGLPAGSEVITTPRSFFATVSAIVAEGLTPVFADVDPDTGNITPQSVTEALTDRTSAILVVHLGGWPADMPGFRELAGRRGLALVEDCAQAHGAGIARRSVGSFGDLAAWSFCTDKIMSTGGEGGMVTTSSDGHRDRIWSLKDHGKSWDEVNRDDHAPGFRWLHTQFGTNLRATEMQAAIGRRQLSKLPEWHSTRRENAEHLAKMLAAVPSLRVPIPEEQIDHAYYRLYAYLRPGSLAPGWSRQRILSEVSDQGIPCFSGSCGEMFREKAMSTFAVPELPVAQELEETSLAFLVHPGLTSRDMTLVGEAITRVCTAATRG